MASATNNENEDTHSVIRHTPHVSIGLPVYNGESFLLDAIESILGQSFENWELIISDNGSTDSTPHICRRISAKDSRIRYERHAANRGAAWNFNYASSAATGTYFKWAAHDDVLASQYLEKCVEVLDGDDSIVLCYPRILRIDEHGSAFGERSTTVESQSEDPALRFRDQIRNDNSCEHVFGLVRKDALNSTRLIGPYATSDRVLLSELALIGRFHEVPDKLFLHRHHDDRFVCTYMSDIAMNHWFQPKSANSSGWAFPSGTLFLNFARAVRRSGVDWKTRSRCYRHLGRWLVDSRRIIQSDAMYAARWMFRSTFLRETPSEFIEHIERELRAALNNRAENQKTQEQ